jgi:hypothetical protein
VCPVKNGASWACVRGHRLLFETVERVFASGRSATRARSRSTEGSAIRRLGRAEKAFADGCESCADDDDRH